jgi:hypothetical protein
MYLKVTFLSVELCINIPDPKSGCVRALARMLINNYQLTDNN